MSKQSKFKCKSNAQKYAIRAYYAKKNKGGKPSQDCEEQRERYMKSCGKISRRTLSATTNGTISRRWRAGLKNRRNE